MKKTKIFIFLSVVAVLWFVWIFAYYFKTKEEITKEEKQVSSSEEQTPFFKTGETKAISKIISEKVFYPKLYSDNEISFYSSSDNSWFIFDLSAKIKKPIFEELDILENEDDLVEVKWYPLIKKVMIAKVKKNLTLEEEEISNSLSRALSEKIIYDLEAGETLAIKSPYYMDLELLAGNKFVYYYFDREKGENKIFQEDLQLGGLSRKELLDLGKQNSPYFIEFYGEFENKLYFSKAESNGVKTFYHYDFENKKNDKVLSGINSVSPSLNFRKAIYSFDNGSRFAIYDFVGNSSYEIKFDGLIDYILWSRIGKYFYYFKGALEEGGRYDFYFLLGEVYKYDLEKNQSEKIADFSDKGNIGIKDIFLSSDEKSFYFTNTADLNLYHLDLEK
jgi:hypothetical protein